MSLNIILRYLQLKSDIELYPKSIVREVTDTVNVIMWFLFVCFLPRFVVDGCAKIQLKVGEKNCVPFSLNKYLDILNFIHKTLSS